MFVVVMAGGAGTRLWPASRNRRPKQFLSLLTPHTLLQETLARLVGCCAPQKTFVLADVRYRGLPERVIPPGVRVLYEPQGRGTAPCLGLAALHLAAEEPGEVMVAVPADNWVAPGSHYAADLEGAAALAAEGGLVAVGTVPDRAASEFGYLKPGPLLGYPGGREAFPVEGFIEKPEPPEAAALCAEGWLWNAGVFAFDPRAFLEEIARLQPRLWNALALARAVIGAPDYGAILAEAWRSLPPLGLEEGILARRPARFRVILGRHSWMDLGNWDAVRLAALAATGGENAAVGPTLLRHARDCLVRAEGGRLVVVAGVQGVTVVDTPDALLVLGPGYGQEVREVTRILARERSDLL